MEDSRFLNDVNTSTCILFKMGDQLKKKLTSIPHLMEFIKSVLSKSKRTTKLSNQLGEVIHYRDVLFYTWKILFKNLSAINESGDIFMLNVLDLLEKISFNKSLEGLKKEENEVLGIHKGEKEFILDKTLLKKHERKVWQSVVNREMSPVVHKKLLFVLLELYLSKLNDPIFLTDFFMSSMNVNGVVRILALQGVATLMQKHNIEYPNIYEKLYTLFEPNIFHTKYKSRLFYLANIFLSSTHLPEILVGSFVKRAARLSLTCASPDILIILRFVGNLLIRHTNLIKMIHHPVGHEVEKDPFIMSENDPMKTRATESSLWEISLHANHCLPTISSAAKFINGKLPSIEYDLSEVLDNTYQGMFESECRKTKKMKPSLTFHRPQDTIARLKDDRLFKLWSLTK